MIFVYTYIKLVNKYYPKKRKRTKASKKASERYQNLSEE